MAGARQSLTVGLSVLLAAAAVGVGGLLWLGSDPRPDVEGVWKSIQQSVSGTSVPGATVIAPSVRLPPDEREEARLLADIERFPRSVDPLYAYALFLYREGRLEESSEQLSELFSMRESHPEAERLHAHINELYATPDAAERRAKRAQFAAELGLDVPDIGASEPRVVVREMDGAQGASLPPPPAPAADSSVGGDREARLRALDARYGISAYSWAWLPSHEEHRRAVLISELETHHKYDEAEAMHREQLRAYPESPDVVRAYVVFFINRGRLQMARQQLTRALGRFPDYPELLIVRDGLAEIRANHDPTLQSRARARLATALSDAAALRQKAASGGVAAR